MAASVLLSTINNLSFEGREKASHWATMAHYTALSALGMVTTTLLVDSTLDYMNKSMFTANL